MSRKGGKHVGTHARVLPGNGQADSEEWGRGHAFETISVGRGPRGGRGRVCPRSRIRAPFQLMIDCPKLDVRQL